MLLPQDLIRGEVRGGEKILTMSFKTAKANTHAADDLAVSFMDLCQM